MHFSTIIVTIFDCEDFEFLHSHQMGPCSRVNWGNSFFSRALSKNNHHIGKRYIEVFESKAGEMEWVCKRMGQPQDKGDESVVRLRGLPYEISKEEIVQFFTGKIKFFIFHNSKWRLFKSDVELKKANSSLKKCPKFRVSLKKCFYSVSDDPNLLLICTFNENKHFSPKINLSTLNRPFPSWCKSPFQSKAKCKAIDMKMIYYSHANKTHFHNKGFCTLPRFESESFDFSGQIRQLKCQ